MTAEEILDSYGLVSSTEELNIALISAMKEYAEQEREKAHCFGYADGYSDRANESADNVKKSWEEHKKNNPLK